MTSTCGLCGDLSGPKPDSNPAQFDWKSALIQTGVKLDTGNQRSFTQIEPEGERKGKNKYEQQEVDLKTGFD